VNSSDFDRHLRLELCWLDNFPTAASHAGQRQCRHCRRKWSYSVLRRQWLLAEEFCKGSTRRAAAVRANTDEHTAGRQYKRFQERLAVHFLEMVRKPDGGFKIDPLHVAEACKTAMKISEKQKRFRLLVDVCLGELTIENRLETIYRTVFHDHVQTLIRNAHQARIKRRLELL